MAEKTFLDNFTAKQAFVMGIVLTILTLGTLGFLYTLKGGSLNLGGKTVNRGVAPSAVAPNPSRNGTPTARGEVQPVNDEDHVRGDVKAPITVIEYSDFECPFCKRFHTTMNQLLSNNDDVRWVYRHFPLDSLHRQARKEAEASECAAEQGKFWEFADKIFEVTPSNDGLDLSGLPDLARQAGVRNIKKFQSCLDSGKYADKVASSLAGGQAAGGTGTPFSIIVTDDRKIPVSGAVPLSQIESILDSLR